MSSDLSLVSQLRKPTLGSLHSLVVGLTVTIWVNFPVKLVQAFANSVEKTVLGEIMSIVARSLSSFRGNRAGSWCFARPGGGWPDRVLNLKSRHPPEMGTFTAPYVKVS